MDGSVLQAQGADIVHKLENILAQIEEAGGEHKEGREALERLKRQLAVAQQQQQTQSSLAQGTDAESDSVPVQMENIRRRLDTLDNKLMTMSDSAREIVSYAGQDTFEQVLRNSQGMPQAPSGLQIHAEEDKP